MSNTKARVISALVMAFLVVLAVFLGKWTTIIAIFIAGALSIDEILINFSKVSRTDFIYKYVLAFFAILYFGVNGISTQFTLSLFTIAALCLNLFLIYYLFKIPLNDHFMKNSTIKHPGLIATLIILPLLSFGIHFNGDYWRQILAILLIVTFGMDTGAWFFGKNFGKTKLWPSVSPKKTVEGLFGGMFISGLAGSLLWWSLFDESRWYYSVIFALCGAISQLGDLVQSKLKREFEIKDSSNLIPGHGGVYDRIDSLIFLSPFFVIVVKYLG